MVQNIAKDFYKILETISAQARTGLAFSKHPYDINRYENILKALDSMYTLLSEDGALLSILSILKKVPIEIGDNEYVTPKVAVATVVFNDNEDVLLVKRLDDIWALPGGYADIPFDPIENAIKEVKEETGLDIKVTALIGIYDSNINKFPSIGRQVYLLVFLGEVSGGILNASLTETKGVNFFELHSLPELASVALSQIQYGSRMRHGEVLLPIIEHNA